MRLHEQGRTHPPIMQAYLNELGQVIDCLHNEVHRKLLVLVAMVLEIPEDVILDMHRNEKSTTNYYRYVCPPNPFISMDLINFRWVTSHARVPIARRPEISFYLVMQTGALFQSYFLNPSLRFRFSTRLIAGSGFR